MIEKVGADLTKKGVGLLPLQFLLKCLNPQIMFRCLHLPHPSGGEDCREVFARGQKPIEVIGPIPAVEEEAA